MPENAGEWRRLVRMTRDRGDLRELAITLIDKLLTAQTEIERLRAELYKANRLVVGNQ